MKVGTICVRWHHTWSDHLQIFSPPKIERKQNPRARRIHKSSAEERAGYCCTKGLTKPNTITPQQSRRRLTGYCGTVTWSDLSKGKGKKARDYLASLQSITSQRSWLPKGGAFHIAQNLDIINELYYTSLQSRFRSHPRALREVVGSVNPREVPGDLPSLLYMFYLYATVDIYYQRGNWIFHLTGHLHSCHISITSAILPAIYLYLPSIKRLPYQSK